MEITATAQTTLAEGIALLMAAYYVYHIQYPSAFRSTLYFFQDILMDKKDKKNKARPTRYSLYLTNLGF